MWRMYSQAAVETTQINNKLKALEGGMRETAEDFDSSWHLSTYLTMTARRKVLMHLDAVLNEGSIQGQSGEMVVI